MSIQNADKKLIAKNTFVLYIRMFLLMGIGLYTSRVILQTLGVSDYGVYNVVGGVVSMLGFLSASLASASQRFISFELGKDDQSDINKVFSTSIIVHFALAIVLVIVLESVGVWFLNNKLNIDSERMTAANWVFQCSIASTFISIISVPYNALIIAHEKMSAFAYISIIEASLKLGVVVLLNRIPGDKLINYAILVAVVSVIIRICYSTYCKIKINSVKYYFVIDKNLFKQMFSFTGWSIVGNLGYSTKDQLSNIILNLFYGTTINAARGVATQVNGAITQFSQAIGTAINPQITKQYAAGNVKESSELVYLGIRIKFYLLILMSVPVIVNVDWILKAWLGTVPDYSNKFLVLILLSTLFHALSGSLSTAIQATGKMRNFTIGVCIILLSELPIAYILLRMGNPPYYALFPTVFVQFVASMYRFYVLKNEVSSYKWKDYIFKICLRCLTIFIVSLVVNKLLDSFFIDNVLSVVIDTLISIFISIALICLFGLSANERTALGKKICGAIKH